MAKLTDYVRMIHETECPFCENALMVQHLTEEIVCSCCERPMELCPQRFTPCPKCEGGSVNDCHCDRCGAELR